MKKSLSLIVLFFCFSFSVCAQNTNVSGTVTDSGGQAWVLGTYEFDFVPSPRFQGQYRQNGVPFNPVSITGNLDATASFSTIPVPDNNTITPSGTQWAVTICPQATTKCFTSAPIIITGASQTITSSLIPPAISMSCGPSQKAYGDVELQCAQGGYYFNLLSNRLRLCTASTPPNTCNTWVDAGTGASGAAAGSPPQTQVNDPGNPGHFGGTPCENFPSLTVGPINADCDWHSKGPNPYVDVTRFGVRACDPLATPCAVGLTANTTISSTGITISSASTFVNGDGIIIYGAGAPQSMTTPGAPTVIPSIAQVLTGTGIVSNGPTGATTYNYQIFAEDKNGGLTAVSAVGTTTTGAASLGSQSVSLSSCSRSNDVVTCTTSSSHGLAVGSSAQMVIINNAVDSSFNGFYSTSNVSDTTHFSFTSGQDTRNGATLSTTGGTVFWFNCNHITWTAVAGAYRYWIAGRTGGSLTTIGHSWPTYGTFSGALFWDDFGSPMMDDLQLPAWIPSTPPAVATNDNLSATIASGAGTTSLVLSTSAGKTVSGVTIRLDAGIGLKAAVTAAFAGPDGTAFPVYFPQIVSSLLGTTHANYVINSFVDLTSFTSIAMILAGEVRVSNTIEFPPSTRVSGLPIMGSPGSSFAMDSLPALIIDTAYPGFHFAGLGGSASSNNSIEHVQVTTNFHNQGLFVVQDGGSPSTGIMFRQVYIGGGGSTNLMGMGLLARDQPGGASNFQFNDVSSLMGPGDPPGIPMGTTATPQIYCTACGQISMSRLAMAHRGILIGISGSGGTAFKLDWGYLGGSLTPFLSMSGGSSIANLQLYGQITLDTVTPPLLTLFPGAGVVVIDNSFGVPGGISPVHPVYSGVKPYFEVGRNAFQLSNGVSGLGLNRDNSGVFTNSAIDGTFATNAATLQGITYTDTHLAVGPSYGIFIDAGPMPAPTAVIAAGGSVPVGAHTYQVAPVWQNGGIGALSYVATATTTTGNQTVNLSWIPVSSCKGYIIERDGSLLLGSVPAPGLTTCSSSSFSDTASGAVGGSGMGEPTGGATMMLPGTRGIATPTLTLSGNALTGIAPGTVIATGYQNSAYDNFNRANGAIGSNWTVAAGGLSVSSNQIVGTGTGVHNSASWTANNFAADQFSEATITVVGNQGVLVRGGLTSFSGDDCEEATTVGGTTGHIYSLPSFGVIATVTLTATAVGDIVRCEARGTTISFFQNGILVGSGTDGTYTTGAPGVHIFDSTTTAFDNWSGGNLHPVAQLDTEQDWTRSQHFTQPVTIGATNPVPGTLNANTLYTNGNAFGSVYATVSATTGASIGTTTMTTAPASGAKYVFNATAAQVAGGTSCTTNSTLALFVNYTDAVTNAAQVPTLGGYSIQASTFAGNNAPVLAINNGTANTMAINWNPMVINAKGSTTVSYGTTYTAGTGCAPAPTYYVTPSLVQIQ